MDIILTSLKVHLHIFFFRFVDLFVTALRETGMLCLGVTRLVAVDSEDTEDLTRVVIGAPDNIFTLQPMDHIIALIQYEEEKEKTE